jgi:hypothetical protein
MTSTETGQTTTTRRSRPRMAIALSLLAVFLVLAAIVTAALQWRHEKTISDGEQRAEILAEILAANLALRVKTLEAVLYEVAAYDRLIGGPDATADEWFPVLRTAFAGLTGFSSLGVADAEGIVTYSTQPMTMRQPVSDGELHRRLAANPRSDALAFDKLFRDSVEGRILLPVGRVLRTPDGAFEGMLVAHLLPGSLGDLLEAVDLGPSTLVRVFSPGGERLVPAPQYADSLERPPPEFPLVLPNVEEDTTGIVVAPIDGKGADYLTAYRTMADTGLTVAVSLPEAEVLAGWRDERNAAIAGIAIVGVLLLLAGFAISRSASSGSAGRT